MPKKQPRNAFYFYVLDFKEEQRKKGINYPNLGEAFNAAGPSWSSLRANQRTKFEELAKKEKAKMKIPEMKFTSTGVSFAELSRQEAETKSAEEMELKEILNIVKLGVFNNTIQLKEFFIMDVNIYCYFESKGEYVISEMTMLNFNLLNGILDEYHEMVNPGKLPLGYASDGKNACEELGLKMPDETEGRSDYMLLLANIMDFLKKSDRTLPPIFTMPNKVALIQNFIQQLCQKAGEDETLFRVYKLDTLFYHLINNIKPSDDEGFPKQSLALGRLNQDTFQYSPGLGCDHHEKFSGDKVIHCTLSRTKRWAYTILDNACPKVNIRMIQGRHVPIDYDLEKIEKYRQESIVNNHNPVACLRPTLDDTNSTVDTTIELNPPIRVHKPLRKPKTDYSLAIRSAPDFDENRQRAGIGRGRGTSLSSGMSQMNIGK